MLKQQATNVEATFDLWKESFDL